MSNKPEQDQSAIQPPLSESEPEQLRERELASQQMFDGILAKVYRDRIQLPDGSESRREYLKHVGAAAVLPVYDNGDVVLIRQFRYPVGRILWEIPAGKLSRGEDPVECGRRELQEETGLTAERWESVLSFHPCVGYSNEVIHIYLAAGLTAGEPELDRGEFLNSHRVTAAEVTRLLAAGEITDGKTLIALQWLRQR